MDLVSSSSVLKHRDLGKQKKVSFMAAVRVPEQAQVKGKTIGDDKVDRSRVAQSVPVPGRTIAAFRARRQARLKGEGTEKDLMRGPKRYASYSVYFSRR